MGGAPVVDHIEALSAQDQIEVFEKEVMGPDRCSRLLQIIGDGQEEIVKSKCLLAQEMAHINDPVYRGCGLAEKADHGPVRVLKVDDMSVVGPQILRIIVPEGIKDRLQLAEDPGCCQTVLRMDPPAGILHLCELGRMFDAEAQFFQPVYKEKCLGLLGQRNQHLARMLGLQNSLLLTAAGDRGQVVYPVGDLHIEGPGVGLVQEFCIREYIPLLFRKFPSVVIPVAQSSDCIDRFRDVAAEHFPDLADRDIAVLHHIVEEGRSQILAFEPILRQEPGGPQAVVDIGLSGYAESAAVHFFRKGIGPFDIVPVSAGMFL